MDVREWLLTSEERENPPTDIDAIRGDGTAWSRGNAVRAIVHEPAPTSRNSTSASALSEPATGCTSRTGTATPTSSSRTTPRHARNTLVDAVKRGADVRGLLWRSHWHRLGFSAHRHRQLGEEIGAAGGERLRDMRVRTRGAHHQKFVVIRYADDPQRHRLRRRHRPVPRPS